ncbi:hypothetical protein GDO81_007195 [Engystomops pustulosus]|uniref:Uncharacterized protein n=1 Tax=Engystomops pustulosus TaxID=76066 RepID=A0AAV7C5C7_ENGPU|nr:hypothetical protein GDO81_007195 [Engystomops pustulosus]
MFMDTTDSQTVYICCPVRLYPAHCSRSRVQTDTATSGHLRLGRWPVELQCRNQRWLFDQMLSKTCSSPGFLSCDGVGVFWSPF